MLPTGGPGRSEGPQRRHPTDRLRASLESSAGWFRYACFWCTRWYTSQYTQNACRVKAGLRPRREIRFSRRNVYLRDANTCQYCGRQFRDEELNLDHVVPRDIGGKTNWENIVTACVRCNSRKANRLPEQAGMTLRHPPTKPKWRLVVASSLSADEVECWKEFLEVTPAGQLPWRN
ncbi:MAG: HNH endonuclease [Acidimicrobiia bacterium]|nr:HNH endonuclease [Acidimicrobiia bacterium]